MFARALQVCDFPPSLNGQEAAADRVPESASVGVAQLRDNLHYYEANADSYARATLGLDMGRRIHSFTSALAPGSRVLDLGCGAGRDLVSLAQAGMAPTGLDLSPALVAIATAHSSMPAFVGDLRRPPFAAGSFDGVWASASLLHIPECELVATLAAVRTMVQTGGAFFASLKRGQGQLRDADGRWFTLHEPEEWHERLRNAGFALKDMATEDFAGSSRWFSSLAVAA